MLRLMRRTAGRLYRRLFFWRLNERKIEAYMSLPGPKKLNLGCGGNCLEGWLNADVHRDPSICYIDIADSLPVPDESIDFIIAEHVIEHISIEMFRSFLAEARRALKKGGVIRLATPDLDFYARILREPGTPEAELFRSWYSKRAGVTEAVLPYLMNSLFYEHGHRFIFNEDMLRHKLNEAGFGNIVRHTAGESARDELRGVEGHGRVPDVGEEINRLETLVLEAEAV